MNRLFLEMPRGSALLFVTSFILLVSCLGFASEGVFNCNWSSSIKSLEKESLCKRGYEPTDCATSACRLKHFFTSKAEAVHGYNRVKLKLSLCAGSNSHECQEQRAYRETLLADSTENINCLMREIVYEIQNNNLKFSDWKKFERASLAKKLSNKDVYCESSELLRELSRRSWESFHGRFVPVD